MTVWLQIHTKQERVGLLGCKFYMDHFFYKESSQYFWNTIVTVRYSNKFYFPATKKNWHNRTTVLYTKYVRTKNYFPPEPKKLTQHHNCIWYSKYIVVCTTKTYFPPEPKTDTTAQLEKRFLQPTQNMGRFLQPTRSKCICFSVRPSVCPSVCE